MHDRMTMPYGAWTSPITADMVASGVVSLRAPSVDGENLYWIEGRPSEGGRNVIVARMADGTIRDVLPEGYNARSRVHEYGGGAYDVRNGVVVFTNFADDRIYRLTEGRAVPITPPGPMRYGDLYLDEARKRVICVREDHSNGGEAINTIVWVPLEGESEGHVLLSGNDFYAFPRMSPDEQALCWVTWCHPNMPWDGTELWLGTLDTTGLLSRERMVAGGKRESIVQPAWSPDSTLYFLSDRTDWWNVYRLRDSAIEPVTQLDAEIGGPLWQLGQTWYAFVDANTLACIVDRSTMCQLAVIDLGDRHLQRLQLPYTEMDGIAAVNNSVYTVASSPTDGPALVETNPWTAGTTVVRPSQTEFVPAEYISVPQELKYETTDGAHAYGWFYPPHNDDFAAPGQELPPLLVLAHGGPTGERGPALSPSIQFWTSRGVAVLDVNYRGSSGFGRPYRESLNGKWGVADVDDCVCGARYLVDRGLVDEERLIISGGSAGGYTTLAALTFRDVFRAGASHFGIADLEPFVQNTHKFESRYIDQLIGPYPERREIYYDRSPIHFADQISVPVILLQGLEDKVVPPNQAEMMIRVLRERGVPYAYVSFEGEGHGFRKGENVKRSLEAEEYFFSRVFGYTLADEVEPIAIENL